MRLGYYVVMALAQAQAPAQLGACLLLLLLLGEFTCWVTESTELS